MPSHRSQVLCTAAALLLVGMLPPAAPAADDGGSFAFVDNEQAGALTLQEDGQPVFSYVYEPRLAEGVDEQYRRACYLHPIYGPAGEPLTADFPDDHPHHRGAWWSWPEMEVRGQNVQLWHPSPLRQRFARWRKQEVSAERAALVAENLWVLDGETVGRETVKVVAHPEEEGGRRAIDLTLTFEAVDDPIKLRGAPTDDKGYGGLSVRAATDFTGSAVRTSEGLVDGDTVQERYRWAELSGDGRGLAVFVAPDHPDYPPPWLIRSSYGGVLNPEWPGLPTATLRPGEPVTLRYRLYIHGGDADQADLERAYRAWVTEAETSSSSSRP